MRAWRGVALVAFGLVSAAVAVGACGRAERNKGLSERVVPLGQPVPKGGGVYKVGSPYQIGGRWYTPREDPQYDQVGIASWYGELFHGRRTANGEIYDMGALSAAHPTLPMPIYARVTNLANGRSLVVRINDRGPYAHDRVIDLSARTAELLGFKQRGTAQVRVTYLGAAPLDGDDSYERRVLAGQSWLRYASSGARQFAGATDSAAVASTTRAKSRAETVMASKAPAAGVPLPARRASAVDPVVVGSITPVAPSARAASAQAVSSNAPVYLQAGSFRQKANAERLRDRLAGLGSVDLSTTVASGTTYYRVRMGPFIQADVAEEALRHAESFGATGAQLVPE